MKNIASLVTGTDTVRAAEPAADGLRVEGIGKSYRERAWSRACPCRCIAGRRSAF